MTREIPLTKGLVALVDDDLFDELSQYKWSVDGSGYPQRRPKTAKAPPLRMHRHILGLGPGQTGDHINCDKLDNRRCNLRQCTPGENSRNRRKWAGTTSQYKGVYWIKKSQKWKAAITFNYKQIHLGYFFNERDAAHIYDAKARELFGPFAQVNFPLEAT